MKKFYIIIILLLITISTVNSKPLFISKTGDDKNPGTIDKPLLTIQKGADLAKPGDSVLIYPGNYNEHVLIKNSGSDNLPIVFTTFNPDSEAWTLRAVIDGTSFTDDFYGLLEINNKQSIIIEYLGINNSPWAGIYSDTSQNININHVSTFNTASSGIGIWNGKNIKILNNDVDSACWGGMQEEITVAGCDSFLVKANLVINSFKEGICIKDGSRNGMVDGNYVEDIANKLGIYNDAWNKHTYNITIKNNYVTNCTEGIVLASEMGGLLDSIWIYNNVVYKNKFLGISISYNGDTTVKVHPIKDVFIINNTAVQNGLTWGGGIANGNKDASNIIVRNNICSQNMSFQIAHEGIHPSNMTIDHNLIYIFLGYPDEERGTDYIEADPMLDTTGFLSLLPGSPAIDKGSPDLAPDSDIVGVQRPQGKGFDIGAFEYDFGTAVNAQTILKSLDNFNIFYNPSTDDLNLTFNLTEYSDVSIKIYNLMGELIYSADCGVKYPGSNNANLYFPGLVNGIYFAEMKTMNNSACKKFLVIR